MTHAVSSTSSRFIAPQPDLCAGPAPRTEPRVVLVTDRAAFAALEREWDALVERTDDQPFFRHAFLRVWLEHFGPRATLRLLTLRSAEGRLVAVLPLILRRSRMHGLPVRELTSASNLHSCRFDLIAEDPAQAATAFIAALRAQSDWDVLRLVDVPDGGAGQELNVAAAQAGMLQGHWRSICSPFISLPATAGARFDCGSTKFRANLRRRRRRLHEQGRVTLERIDGGPALQRQLEDGLRLEARGWKGSAGTAIMQDPATLGFYLTLAHHAAARGMLRLWVMRLDGRAIAFHFALEHGGRYLLLKPAYDESLGACSPGQLLMQDVLEDCVRRGLREFDFLGPDMPWKRDWTTTTRPHAWLYVYRGWRGRMLHSLKFRIAPIARELMTRWKR
jgi:CelD/BcsL family acetyltransferase involved in cellulose biosynthesis